MKVSHFFSICCITYYLIKIAALSFLRRYKVQFQKKKGDASMEPVSEYSHERFNMAGIKIIIYIAAFMTTFLYEIIV